jgi:hypothetical protein
MLEHVGVVSGVKSMTVVHVRFRSLLRFGALTPASASSK